ncbi:MAG TPA: alpha/beta hydrolase [Cellvibrio sp.]
MLTGLQMLAYAACEPGVYSDGVANVVVLREKSVDTSGLGYLTMDGYFGNTGSGLAPFHCEPGLIRPNNKSVASLAAVPLRRTLTTFVSAKTQLTGELIEPLHPPNNKYPLVVMVHGSEQSPAIGNMRARLLTGLGIAVFVYDKRGTGQSEGLYTQNFELLAEDATAAMNHARKLAEGRIGRAGFWGASQGGWVAPLAATRVAVDFVVVGYGLVASPIEEDLDQMLLEAQQQQLGIPELKQINRLSKITSKILLSNFKSGLGELEILRNEQKLRPWFNSINGEYSGAMLRMSDIELRRVGRALFDNLELIWDYDSMPVLKKLKIPMLWIVAEKDREAPAPRTLEALAGLKQYNPALITYTFPDTDHGMYEFNELPDGTRTNTRITDGYFRLIAEWINEKENPFSGNAIPR